MSSHAVSGKSGRRHDIDWLRVMAVFLLIPIHTARIFDIWEPFYVKNAEVSGVLSYVFISVVAPWHMPLLFLLAGAATWFAMGHRTPGQYASERFKRLLIPFLFGILVVVPPQVYLASFQNGSFLPSFANFLASYFQLRGDLTGYTGLFTPGQLWFIFFLFVFALVGLPLFVALRGEGGSSALSRIAAAVERRPALLLLCAVLLTATELLPDIGGKNPFTYMALFIAGFVLVSQSSFEEAIDRLLRPALLLGTVTMAIHVAVSLMQPHWAEFAWQSILYDFVRDFNMWFWILALLGLGRRFLSFENSVLRYANEAAYPFYILQQTMIVAIGFVVVTWDLAVLPKFLIIAVASLASSLVLYEGVRRTTITRFLFGMKTTARRVLPQPQPAGM